MKPDARRGRLFLSKVGNVPAVFHRLLPKDSRMKTCAVVSAEPAYSTQECFFCGALNPVDLSVREFACRGCGMILDRDVNAAKIMLNRAIARVGQDMPELMPVEVAPLLLQSTGGASAAVEAETTRAAGSPQRLGAGGCHVRRVMRPLTYFALVRSR